MINVPVRSVEQLQSIVRFSIPQSVVHIATKRMTQRVNFLWAIERDECQTLVLFIDNVVNLGASMWTSEQYEILKTLNLFYLERCSVVSCS